MSFLLVSLLVTQMLVHYNNAGFLLALVFQWTDLYNISKGKEGNLASLLTHWSDLLSESKTAPTTAHKNLLI